MDLSPRLCRRQRLFCSPGSRRACNDFEAFAKRMLACNGATERITRAIASGCPCQWWLTLLAGLLLVLSLAAMAAPLHLGCFLGCVVRVVARLHLHMYACGNFLSRLSQPCAFGLTRHPWYLLDCCSAGLTPCRKA